MAPLLLLLALSSLLAGQAMASAKVVTMPVRHGRANHTSHLMKRDAFAATLQNVIPGHQYYTTVKVGSPPQTLEIFIDTGSSDTWMFATDACHSTRTGRCLGGEFDKSKSSTFKNLQPKLGLYKNIYGDGSKVEGPFFSDTLTVGSETVKSAIMGLVTQSSGIIRAGILGVGYAKNEGSVALSGEEYPNFPVLLVKQGLISSMSYSLYLDDLAESTGSVIFGGYDPTKYVGDLTMFPIQNDPLSGEKIAFYVSMTDFGVSFPHRSAIVSSPHDPYPIPVLLDSGTENIEIPLELFEPLISTFHLQATARGTDGLFGAFLVDCNLAEKIGQVSAIFKFGSSTGGKLISVAIEELIIPFYGPDGAQFTSNTGEPICRFGISAAPPFSPIVLGQPFLRSAYVLYDLDNNAVGLAQAKFDKQSIDIREYSASGSNTRVTTDVDEPTAKTVDYLSRAYITALPFITPSISVIHTEFNVPYPNTQPASSVAPTPSVVLGSGQSQSGTGAGTGGGGGSGGGGGGGGSGTGGGATGSGGNNSNKSNGAKELSPISSSSFLVVAATLLMSFLGTLYIL